VWPIRKAGGKISAKQKQKKQMKQVRMGRDKRRSSASSFGGTIRISRSFHLALETMCRTIQGSTGFLHGTRFTGTRTPL
jgi:hypothetical protein